ncbi:MFS transporter [Amycolatopsis tucumanensis]|uniref:MFS-type drug efflux transporter P55 n=1 Tax=Amycolatopsis tucumanensis TaxID=401106 RepID=A0ABP7JN32_9PSEU|nr:MFS transporter [Amycolatopsis tucumanensis]MCF6428880.1 MFS transporter [Amycolatopsis tucumanensis]
MPDRVLPSSPGATADNAPDPTADKAPSLTTGNAPSPTADKAPSLTTGNAPSPTTDKAPSLTTGNAPSPTTDNAPSPTTDNAPSPTAGIALDPATGRPAGRAQALVLLFASCLSVLGSVLLAPVLPSIQQAFAGTPGVAALTPVLLTVPALVIGLTATVAGRIVDRLGRKRLLVGALVVYAVVGTAPLWLDSLHLILASRILVGLTEAAIMTCCTTLLADYFAGPLRNRYFGLQTVFTTVAATVFLAVGGLLGAHSWRTPFWLYAVSLPLAFLAARHIWQPRRTTAAALPPLPWRRLLTPVGVTLIGGLVFYVLIVELSYVLDGIGVKSSSTIGFVSAIASLATAVAAWSFAKVARFGPRVTIPAAFVLSGLGVLGLGLAQSLPVAVAGAVVAGLGNGLLLPALLTWALGSLTFEQRGRGTGVWTSAMFIGQFVCPLVVLGLSGVLTGLSSALLVVGAVAVLVAGGTRFIRA